MPSARRSTRSQLKLARIISGGQTGVDRAALDVAIELGIPHGGSCPRGRRAEDGQIPSRYRLTELESRDYRDRTLANVQDSDGTLLLATGPLRGGTRLTRQFAKELGKPHLVVDLNKPLSPQDVRGWLTEFKIRTLNVAGPRESSQSGIGALAADYLRRVLNARTARRGTKSKPQSHKHKKKSIAAD